MASRRSSVFDKARGDTSGFRYKLYGGAAERPNSVSGFADPFYEALMAMYDAAPPEVQRELGITSGYRDFETQQKLFNASDRTGHSVARPGHSKHESGNAADLFGFGLGGDSSASEATRNWVAQNAAAHGLYFPMSWEPWHIQLKAQQVAQADAQMKAAGYTPEQRRNAIASIESAGSGDYSAIGPEADPAGHHALGRYQVMDYNLDPWAKQYLKMDTGLDRDAFLKDPKLQDKLFDAVMSDYVNKYGEEGAAQAWFGGPGSVGKGGAGKDVLGTSGNDYVSKYMAALQGTPTAQHPPNPTVGTGGYVKPGADTTQVPDAKKKGWKGFGDAFGGAIADMGKGVDWKMPQLEAQPEAARIDAPVAPIIDTNYAQQQRQYLAQVMAQLNQNRVV